MSLSASRAFISRLCQQLVSNRALTVHLAANDSAEALIEAVRQRTDRAVFVEPLTNTPGLRLLDLKDLYQDSLITTCAPRFGGRGT
jgi:cystathionine beta-lyase/cystathionine gamma-synthase